MRIGFDLDEVLADNMPALVRFHNEMYDTHLTKDDILDYNISSAFGCDLDEAYRRVTEFYYSPHVRTILPLYNSVEIITKLHKDHTMVIITARPECAKELSKQWIDTYFPGVFDELYHVEHHILSIEKISKADACTQLGVSLFVDDAPHNALGCRHAGIDSLLFDQPWNRHVPSSEVKRVYSWDDILSHIQGLV